MMTHGPRLTRRRLLGTSAGLGAAAILPGAAAGSPRAIRPGLLALRQDDPGPTTFMNWEATEGTPTEAAVLAYQEATGRTVEIIPTPGTGTDYETKVRTMLAGGGAPDVIRTNDDFVRFYSSKEQFTDLTPYIERDGINPADYFEPVWNFTVQPNGAYTAVSLGNQPRLIYYNVDLFEAAGVPLPPKDWTADGWTWDDFLATAQQLTIPGEQWGALVYDDTGCEQTFAVNNGQTDGIYSADGLTFTLAEPQGVEAIQWLADLTLVHGVQPERGLVRETNTGNNLFLQGKVGMIFRTQGTMAYFRNNDISFRFDVAPVPAKVDQKVEGSLICYAIPTIAENPEGGWELLKFLMGPEGAQVFADRGDFIPGNKAAAATIEPEPGVSPENLGLFATAMNYHVSVNFTEYTEDARNTYRPQLDLVWTGESTAEEVLTGVRAEVEEILSGAF
jgi:multiple sugar transport system substrate-binding protein